MTSYDRGQFVAGQTIVIDPLSNGTFLISRKVGQDWNADSADQMAFSSAGDMMRFLQSEYRDTDFDEVKGDTFDGMSRDVAGSDIKLAKTMIKSGVPEGIIRSHTTLSAMTIALAHAELDSQDLRKSAAAPMCGS